jgi:uncharacterized protein (TIGR00297 family)
MNPLDALAISTALAFGGWLARALTPAGAAAATLVGWAVLAGTGWPGAAALGAFFVTSSLVSRMTEKWQPGWLDVRGHRRDPWQVAANGGAACAGGVIGFWAPEPGLWIVVCALAAASADTWATSLGVLRPGDPRHVVRWNRVPRGTSGGVSLIGTLGGAAGAVVVAAAPTALGAPAALGIAAVVLGTLGMVADSVLGATVQGRFECRRCGVRSERRRHRCGLRTHQTGGLRWLGNDGVNAFATGLAGLAGWLWWLCWAR